METFHADMFDLEDGGDVFLRNVGSVSADYTRYTPENGKPRNHEP
jgi:hypothetical protein